MSLKMHWKNSTRLSFRRLTKSLETIRLYIAVIPCFYISLHRASLMLPTIKIPFEIQVDFLISVIVYLINLAQKKWQNNKSFNVGLALNVRAVYNSDRIVVCELLA